MIESFGNKEAAVIFHEGKAKGLLKELRGRAIFLLDIMDAVETLEELNSKGFPPSLRLPRLKHDRKGEFAIDIHKLKGRRITFKFEENVFKEVRIEDYH